MRDYWFKHIQHCSYHLKSPYAWTTWLMENAHYSNVPALLKHIGKNTGSTMYYHLLVYEVEMLFHAFLLSVHKYIYLYKYRCSFHAETVLNSTVFFSLSLSGLYIMYYGSLENWIKIYQIRFLLLKPCTKSNLNL